VSSRYDDERATSVPRARVAHRGAAADEPARIATVPDVPLRPRDRRLLLLAAVGLVLVGSLLWLRKDHDPGLGGVGSGLALAVPSFLVDEPLPRDLDPYAGLGTWVDVFDYAPAYAGEAPAVTPSDLDDMAAAGVRTVYLQAVRNDDRAPDRIVDDELVARFLIEAHRLDLRVVGWYLPRLGDLQDDLDHVVALADFEVAGHRFDGVALDIEDVETEPDVDRRNDRLVDLSEASAAHLDGAALGAIVLPPVLIETVNDAFWPRFPWAKLTAHYDVWLPMSYWTQRRQDSGFQDGFTYNAESSDRLRTRIADPDAVLHGIGGIGDEVDPTSLEAFGRSLAETGAVGGSIYDWSTLSDTNREALAATFDEGAAADLPPPPPTID
jgi:hypothetical protein